MTSSSTHLAQSSSTLCEDKDEGLIIQELSSGAKTILKLSGALDVKHARVLYDALVLLLHRHGTACVILDLEHLDSLDSAGIAVVSVLCDDFYEAKRTLVLEHVRKDHQEALMLMPARSKHSKIVENRAGLFEGVGQSTVDLWHALGDFLNLFVLTLKALFKVMIFVVRLPRGAVLEQVVRLGIDAMPIVAMLGLLLGLIMGFEGAYQFQAMGASAYVANLVGTAMSREFGPMMAAIILAGRSGAAMAAELGTMKVQEEVDALKTMGFDPVEFLVVPRVLALLLVQPALSMIAIVLGILGGMMIAVWYLGITASSYWTRTVLVVSDGDMTQGLMKSVIFALIIGLLGCYHGLFIKGGASSVGQATMRAVVSAIFMIIVADALFTTITALLNLGG